MRYNLHTLFIFTLDISVVTSAQVSTCRKHIDIYTVAVHNNNVCGLSALQVKMVPGKNRISISLMGQAQPTPGTKFVIQSLEVTGETLRSVTRLPCVTFASP